MADEPGDFATGALGDFRCQFFLGAFVFIKPDFDQFVDVERFIDGSNQRVGDTVLADEDDGLQVVGQAAEPFALWGGQCGQGASSLVRVWIPSREPDWVGTRAEEFLLICSEVRILQFCRTKFQDGGYRPGRTSASAP